MAPKSRKGSAKKKHSAHTRALKRGYTYQKAVASVAKRIDPSAYVVVGVWTIGPDGRRDLDVVVCPKGADSVPSVVIECKDWNRPIGIGFIDALDSKRRDIGASVAMICSNSGFTAAALRKAARVGIRALAALIEGDTRIRVVVREQIYTRTVTFIRNESSFHYQNPLSDEQKAAFAGVCTKDLTYGDKSIEAWIASKLLWIASFATDSRSFVARTRFRNPIPIRVDARNVNLFVTGIDVRAAFTIQWMTQTIEIGASQGMYDYLQNVVVFGPGPYQFHLKNVNTQTWGTSVGIEDVPPRLLIPFDKQTSLGPGLPLMQVTLGVVKNLPESKDPPDFDPFIDSEEIVDGDSRQETN